MIRSAVRYKAETFSATDFEHLLTQAQPLVSGSTRRRIMATICRSLIDRGPPLLTPSHHQIVLMAAMIGCAVLSSSQARAQWWSRGPADFEECADIAEKAAGKEARKSALSECNAKFAGRRKPGGGYAYFDFMQNRNFDIAGPNPTPEEQKRIDEQYAIYLENQRRSSIAAAFAAKQQQLQQASLVNEGEKPPSTTGNIGKPPTPVSDPRRMKPTGCLQHSFSCEWPRLSEGIKDLKKALFGPPSSKAKRS
jgi:hypothetical protein